MEKVNKPSVLICLESYNNYNNDVGGYTLIKECLSRLRSCFHLVFLRDLEQNENIKHDIVGAVIPGINTQFTNKLLASLPNLKVISNHGMGVDHLDLKWAKEKGIRVGNTKYVVSESTANLAFTLLLVSTRKILKCVDMAMKSENRRFVSSTLIGTDVSDKTLGIVGMGDIGFKVALRARVFGMKIIYHNRTRRSQADECQVKATFYPRLKDMLPESDVVVVACPCTKETMNMISAEEFQLMKKTSLLINIARGKIVDTNALVTALQSNEIQGAALDVTEPEPLPQGHPLLSMSNVVITPHCGTFTFETRLKMCDLIIENLECGLEGKAMPSEIIL